MAAYRVITHLVIARDTAGRMHHKYEGQMLPQSPDPEQLRQMLDAGVVEEIGEDQ
jgi:hypothetical protein